MKVSKLPVLTKVTKRQLRKQNRCIKMFQESDRASVCDAHTLCRHRKRCGAIKLSFTEVLLMEVVLYEVQKPVINPMCTPTRPHFPCLPASCSLTDVVIKLRSYYLSCSSIHPRPLSSIIMLLPAEKVALASGMCID